MENKISASGLAAMLAIATGKQHKLCEDFVTHLFSIVEEELEKGESVRIKGFGTFKLVDVEPRKSVNVVTGEDYEIPGHRKVTFVAGKELASLVNAPFGVFEAVEIADEIPTDDFDGDVEVCPEAEDEEMPEEDSPVQHKLATEAEAEDSKMVADVKAEPENGESESDDPASGQAAEEAVSNAEESGLKAEDVGSATEEAVSATEDEDDSPELMANGKGMEEESFWKRYRFIIGFVAGICASLLIGWVAVSVAGYFEPAPTSPEKVVVVEETEVAKMAEPSNEAEVADPEVPTAPTEEPVYDTVTTTRYLTTIAQEHYGNFNLWPIIYEENASILGHPDRIRPGTRVVVPPLSKYDVNPDDKEQIKAIKQKGNAIYARYR